MSALKTNLEGVARNLNNQFAKLAERLDRMERAEADLHAKLAHIGEAVDRLEMARERREGIRRCTGGCSDHGHNLRKAYDDKRLLLLVDGIDEWENETAANTAFGLLQSFTERHANPVIVAQANNGP